MAICIGNIIVDFILSFVDYNCNIFISIVPMRCATITLSQCDLLRCHDSRWNTCYLKKKIQQNNNNIFCVRMRNKATQKKNCDDDSTRAHKSVISPRAPSLYRWSANEVCSLFCFINFLVCSFAFISFTVIRR